MELNFIILMFNSIYNKTANLQLYNFDYASKFYT